MGRQIQLLMSIEDEADLLSFLRSTCELQIFESFAPSTEALWVENFAPSFEGHWSYRIWNKAFAWNPEYGSVGENSHNPEHIGWRYISNLGTAPVLEVTRSRPDLSESGRLYWARNFSEPKGLNYDVDEFSRWIDKIWYWVRKHGCKVKALPLQPYALPHALSRTGVAQL